MSGRVQAPGEINGKSGNLNNCLQNVIYAGALATQTAHQPSPNTAAATTLAGGGLLQCAAVEPTALPSGSTATEPDSTTAWKASANAIPVQEVVVVFDADMVCKPHFFRHVSTFWP